MQISGSRPQKASQLSSDASSASLERTVLVESLEACERDTWCSYERRSSMGGMVVARIQENRARRYLPETMIPPMALMA